MPTDLDIAQWMLDTTDKFGELYQRDAVSYIALEFGEEFTYVNRNGNLAIHSDVLKEFKKLSKNEIVWSRKGRFWRIRQPDDEPGRQQRW